MLGQLLEMMKKAIQGAHTAKLQQVTADSGIINPLPRIQGESDRMVQSSGGDQSMSALSSSFPSVSHEVDHGFLPIPIPVPVPALPGTAGDDESASASLSIILTTPSTTSTLTPTASSASSHAPALCGTSPLSNDVDQALNSFTTSGTYVFSCTCAPFF